VRRAGDVNRHTYTEQAALRRLIDEIRPDVVDIHEEPFSCSARQWLRARPRDLPTVMYSAQNIDKRIPPPFFGYERAAHRHCAAFYPCSRQAASVLRGKGFAGTVEILPLGYDDQVFYPGAQSVDREEIVLLLVGRLIAEKGADAAVHTLARVLAVRPARLVISGKGPEEAAVRELADSLGVADRVEFRGWRRTEDLACDYRSAHVLMVPSRPTSVAEQFGRVIVEAQASGVVVAGYDCGAIPEVAGESAVIVPVGDVDQLADAVAHVAVDRADFVARQSAGRLQALDRTWNAVATRQIALYELARTGPGVSQPLPRSPRQRRELARGEFGSTAATPSGPRPFSLPFLRRNGPLARLLAGVIDGAAEFGAFAARARGNERDSVEAL
jgi:glycosyltransferase involved in cell wall biosynthesis